MKKWTVPSPYGVFIFKLLVEETYTVRPGEVVN